MISLIICSRKPDISQDLKQNIQATIGVDYELVVIDNSNGTYDIFQAYNIGVERSSYPILCFMHDDIHYHTANWGHKVVEHFKEPSTGAIGIAGSPYAPKMPGSWWGGGLICEMLVHASGPKSKKVGQMTNNRSQVVVLDGVWISIRKDLFQSIYFDERNYGGFHFYDIDICLQAATLGYKLFCVYDIWIQHFGNGTMNVGWLQNALISRGKWIRHLPIASMQLSYKARMEAEYKTLAEYLRVMITNKEPKLKTYSFGVGLIIRNYIGYPYVILRLFKSLSSVFK